MEIRNLALLIPIFHFLTFFSSAQQSKIDSLQNFLKNAQKDTAKVGALNELVNQLRFFFHDCFFQQGNIEQALHPGQIHERAKRNTS